MSCNIVCRLNGFDYYFKEDNLKQYRDAVTECEKTVGGDVALVNSKQIEEKLQECCPLKRDYWVKTSTTATNTCFHLQLTPTATSISTSDCNFSRRYICQVPYIETTIATTTSTTTILSSTAHRTNAAVGNTTFETSNDTPTDVSAMNAGAVMGAIFAVLLLLTLIVVIYHYRVRRLTRQDFTKAGMKTCVVGCCTSQKKTKPADLNQTSPQEDHGYYSIQLHESNQVANSEYSFITDVASRPQSLNQTPDLASNRRITPPPPPPGALLQLNAAYENLNDHEQQGTGVDIKTSSSPPPPTVQKPEVGSGVTYTTLFSTADDESAEGSGVSYTTIARVMNQPPADEYATVNKVRR